MAVYCITIIMSSYEKNIVASKNYIHTYINVGFIWKNITIKAVKECSQKSLNI